MPHFFFDVKWNSHNLDSVAGHQCPHLSAPQTCFRISMQLIVGKKKSSVTANDIDASKWEPRTSFVFLSYNNPVKWLYLRPYRMNLSSGMSLQHGAAHRKRSPRAQRSSSLVAIWPDVKGQFYRRHWTPQNRIVLHGSLKSSKFRHQPGLLRKYYISLTMTFLVLTSLASWQHSAPDVKILAAVTPQWAEKM